MPANQYRATLTGLSCGANCPTYFPDTFAKGGFSVNVFVATTSSSLSFSVQHTLDYPGPNSSAFRSSAGWISSNAFWFTSSGITNSSCDASTTYTYPVSAIRLNSTGGNAAASVTMTITQG